MIWDEILAKLDSIANSCEKLAKKWAPDEIRNPGPPFSNYVPPSPIIPAPVIVPDASCSATIGGAFTTTLPFNQQAGQGAHVEVRNCASLIIPVPAGFFGRKQLEVSNIAPGQPDLIKLTLNGIALQVPFAGGYAKLPSGDDPYFAAGIDYNLVVSVEPIGFGCSLQLR